jgi:hypothetical protein
MLALIRLVDLPPAYEEAFYKRKHFSTNED